MKRALWTSLTTTLFAVMTASVWAASLSDVPTGLVEQFKKLKPQDRARFAREYGIDIDVLRAASLRREGEEGAELGRPGEEVVPVFDGELEDAADLAEEEKEKKLARFGEGLFNKEITTFAPVDNIPVPEGYRIRTGDELSVIFIGNEQSEFDLVVGREGEIVFPRLGLLSVGGLTFAEARRLVEARVAERLIGTSAIVSMGRLRSITIFLAGEVNNPGAFSVSSLTTITQALYVAGGISDVGTYRNIQVKRNGKFVGNYDVYDLLLKGDNTGDIRLESGDVVFVPMMGSTVRLEGEVARPGIFEIVGGEKISALVTDYAGVLPTSNLRNVLVKRYSSTAGLPSLINLNFVIGDQSGGDAVNGDTILVRKIPDRVSNPIFIEGASDLAGLIAWEKNLRVSDVIDDLETDFQPTADRDIALVVRRINQANDLEVLSFSPTLALDRPGSEQDPELLVFDKLLILPLPVAELDMESSEMELKRASGPSGDKGMEESRAKRKAYGMRDRKEFPAEEELTRRDLLQPIVDRLKQQASSGSPPPIIAISGAVRIPAEYPLVGGGSIADQIALAGGYVDGAFLGNVEVRRTKASREQEAEIEFLELDLRDEAGGSGFSLQSRDSVRINYIPNYSTDDTIELTGEFLFPGTYKISPREKLSSVVRRAGGFTNQAYVQGARFFSKVARDSQVIQLKKISASIKRQLQSRQATGLDGQVSVSSKGEIIDGALESGPSEDFLGRIVVDLDAISRGTESADLAVENGDKLHVPKFSPTIAVVGEVYEPGIFQFREDFESRDYIRQAGGETAFALSKNTYILKANGSVSFTRGNRLSRFTKFTATESEILPGDTLVIPTDLDYNTPLERISSVTGVIFQSVTSLAAFLSLSNQ